MADPKSQQDAQAEGGALEVTEFDSLLRKEFKPKTDEAKEAVAKPSGRWRSRRCRRRP